MKNSEVDFIEVSEKIYPFMPGFGHTPFGEPKFGWDATGCFFIGDILKNDSIIVQYAGQKERGVVVKVVPKKQMIHFINSKNETKVCGINQIVFLKEKDSNWL